MRGNKVSVDCPVVHVVCKNGSCLSLPVLFPTHLVALPTLILQHHASLEQLLSPSPTLSTTHTTASCSPSANANRKTLHFVSLEPCRWNCCAPSSGIAMETNDNELWDTLRNSCFGNNAMGSVYTTLMVETPFRALFLSEKTRRRDNNGVRVTLQLSQILAFNKLSSSKLECIYCCDCSENFCRKRKYCYAVVPSARYAGSELVSLKGFLGHLLLR